MSKKGLAGLVLVAVALMGAAGNAQATQPGCYIFNEPEWEGEGRYLQPNTRYDRLDRFRRSVKSVMLSIGCRLDVYEREDFNGPRHEFDEDRKRVGAWETKIESLNCRCE